MNPIERIKPYLAKPALTSLLRQVRKTNRPIIFESRGNHLAALISMRHLRKLMQALETEEDEHDWQEIQDALADPRNAKPIPWDTLKRELDLQNHRVSDRGRSNQTVAAKAASPRQKRARRPAK